MSFPKNIALIHDWLISMRGGEKVFEVLCEMFPNADIFTLVHKNGSIDYSIEKMKIHTSFIQHLPNAIRWYQYYLPLYPMAIERFNLDEYDLVISSSHAAAKGVRTRKDALHICYCHTPMRYIWDQYEQYFGKGRASIMLRNAVKLWIGYLRKWDIESSKNVNYFVANSRNVSERIKRIYNRDSEVIYPPVDVKRFSISNKDDGFYLVVSALVPYKRIDIAINAFNKLGEKLVVIGTGSEEKKLKSIAKKNIEFLGWVDDEQLIKYYQGCRCVIFPGEEDFGIVPVESMACGKPVIAYGKGGALETVIDGKTGILFYQQTPECLIDKVRAFDKSNFNSSVIRTHVEGFDKNIFLRRISNFINEKYAIHLKSETKY